jgi:hypothetical protein
VSKADIAEIRRECFYAAWRGGYAVDALLDSSGPTGGQREWVKKFWEGPPKPAVWNIGRQRGKTFAAGVLMVSFALFRSKSIIRYCAKTKESAAEIIGPTFQEIFETMPPEIRPEKRRGSFEFFFRNHSRIVVFGTDAQSFDRGRGPGTGLLVFDEYAFFQDLPSIESALIPTLITTGGRTLYLSSPPRKPGHPAVQRIRTAEKDGRLTTDTFWNNPRINHEEVIAFECSRLGVSREGLLASAYFRREYLAEILEDEGEFFNAEWFKFLDDYGQCPKRCCTQCPSMC